MAVLEVGLVVVELVLVLVVGVLVVVDVVVEVVVVGDVVLELEELELLELWQSLGASRSTVFAPSARFWSRVVLTLLGRFAT